jgi:mono/diheme cytochrome c family protein
MKRGTRRRLAVSLGLAAPLALLGGVAVRALVTAIGEIDVVHDAQAEHVDQDELMALVRSNQGHEAFERAFDVGDELFEAEFNALDGAGANVGRGMRFSRVPRADLKGTSQWFNHKPKRVTGPNTNSCVHCHISPFEDGGGNASANVHRDPLHSGQVSQFVIRNTPHLFGSGAVQRLAEEMTDELAAIRTKLVESVCATGTATTVKLVAKGVSFGTLGATRASANPCRVTFNTDGVRGIDLLPSVDNPDAPTDLIVRPFQWKGSVPFLRDFNRGAAHNEIGMQAVEITGDDVDGDFDGVKNEFTIGDMTAMAIYIAAQPRPTTLGELAALGLASPLPAEQVQAIQRGAAVFRRIGCAECHVPRLTLNDPVFSEPSRNPAYRDGDAFPAGQGPVASGVDPQAPVTFDLTRDHPDNIIRNSSGQIVARLGSFKKEGSVTVVELFGDLKRHEMGPNLAESINEISGDDATPIRLDPRNRRTPSSFLTENLWGVGSTAPYMHDGRATTLAEAILEHATSNPNDPSEAAPSRRAYLASSAADKRALCAFLESLVIFKVEEVDGTAQAQVAPQVPLRIRRSHRLRR